MQKKVAKSVNDKIYCIELKGIIRNQKGITIIALVATIIVMLILLGVTIDLSLDGQLFGAAEQVKNQTQILEEKEQLLSQALIKLEANGKVNFDKLKPILIEKYGATKIESNTDNSITVTLPSQNRYVITQDAEINYYEDIKIKPTPNEV